MYFSKEVFYTQLGWPLWSGLAITILALCMALYCDVPNLYIPLTCVGIVEMLALGIVIQTSFAIINGKILRVYWPFSKPTVISIGEIKHISINKSIRVPPAYAQCTLIIIYSNDGEVRISPHNHVEFLATIKRANPRVKMTSLL
ncbi:MAG: PH domain-containing protein [Lewinellaceae bacterium]|jgi:hypothetical protein|nr:PH domain-containing protein [Lewinellaceae bacterium]